MKTDIDSPNAKRSAIVYVSRVLKDDHYKRMSRVTVGRTLTAQWLQVPSIGKNLRPLTVKVTSLYK